MAAGIGGGPLLVRKRNRIGVRVRIFWADDSVIFLHVDGHQASRVLVDVILGDNAGGAGPTAVELEAGILGIDILDHIIQQILSAVLPELVSVIVISDADSILRPLLATFV